MIKPTHRLKILNKETNEKCNDAGAGWLNKDDSITVVFSSFIDVTSISKNRNMVFTLFQIDKKS